MDDLKITIEQTGPEEIRVGAVYNQTNDYPRDTHSLRPFFRETLIQLTQAEDDPDLYGKILGELIFQDEIYDIFRFARTRSESFRLIVIPKSQNLSHLRWERLKAPFDSGHWTPLMRCKQTHFSIYLPSMVAHTFEQPGSDQLKALIFIANPKKGNCFGITHFDEQQALEQLRPGLGRIPYTYLGSGPEADAPATLHHLSRELSSDSYHILHIMCHGLTNPNFPDGLLYFNDENGEVQPVPSETLLSKLNHLIGPGNLPHLCFLAACDVGNPRAEHPEAGKGSLSHRMVRELGIPAVIAMTEKIAIDAALALFRPFYTHLRETAHVDIALNRTLFNLQDEDATVPVLYGRLNDKAFFGSNNRPLSPRQFKKGLERLYQLAEIRAPFYLDLLSQSRENFKQQGNLPDPLRSPAGIEIDKWSRDLAGIPFGSLCRGSNPLPYKTRCPFPGLQPFSEADADIFGGRKREILSAVESLREHRILTITGVRGCGKSSLIHAGILPAWRKKIGNVRIRQLELTQGQSSRLEETLRDIDQSQLPTLLVLDQLESLRHMMSGQRSWYRLCLRIRRRVHSGSNLFLLIAVSEDPARGITQSQDFQRLFGTQTLQLHPLKSKDLKWLTHTQAAAASLHFEDDLIDLIAAEIGDQPGHMSLWQHLLNFLWQRRRGFILCREAFTAWGNAAQQLSRVAESFYNNLSESEQKILSAYFVRLVHAEESKAGRGYHPIQPKTTHILNLLPTQKEDTKPALNLLYRMAAVPLVKLTNNEHGHLCQVTPINEGLLQNWSRLRLWLGEQDPTSVFSYIHCLAERWYHGGEDPKLLPQWNENLDRAEALFFQSGLSPSWLEQTFIAACRKKEAQEKQQILAVSLREKRHLEKSRRWILGGCFIIAFLLSVALKQWRVAESGNKRLQQQNTQLTNLNRDFQNLGSELLFQQSQAHLAAGRYDQALFSLAKGSELGIPPDQFPAKHYDLIQNILFNSPHLYTWTKQPIQPRSVAFSEQEELLLILAPHQIMFRKLPHGEAIRQFPIPSQAGTRCFASKPFHRFALVAPNGVIQVFDFEGIPRGYFDQIPEVVSHLSFFSPSYLFIALSTGQALIIDMERNRILPGKDLTGYITLYDPPDLEPAFLNFQKSVKKTDAASTCKQKSESQDLNESWRFSVMGTSRTFKFTDSWNKTLLRIRPSGQATLSLIDPGTTFATFNISKDFHIQNGKLSPSGRFFWAESEDGECRLYELSHLFPRTHIGKDGSIGPARFDSQGRVAVSAYYDRLYIHNLRQENAVLRTLSKEAWIKDIRFTKTGLLVLAEKDLYLFSKDSEPRISSLIRETKTTDQPILSSKDDLKLLDVSPTGTVIAAATDSGGLLILRNLNSSLQTQLSSIKLNDGEIAVDGFWLDETTFFLLSISGTLWRVQTQTGNLDAVFKDSYQYDRLSFDKHRKMIWMARKHGEVVGLKLGSFDLVNCPRDTRGPLRFLKYDLQSALLIIATETGVELFSPNHGESSFFPFPADAQVRDIAYITEKEESSLHIITENGAVFQIPVNSRTRLHQLLLDLVPINREPHENPHSPERI